MRFLKIFSVLQGGSKNNFSTTNWELLCKNVKQLSYAPEGESLSIKADIRMAEKKEKTRI